MSATLNIVQDSVIDEAFAIAWDYVKRTGRVADDYYAQVFLSREILRLLNRGENHKIRLANLAVAAFERDGRGFQPGASLDPLPRRQ